MKAQKLVRILLAGCTAAALFVLSACSTTQSNPVADAQAANRQYMADVNQTMENLEEKLTSFTDAVARGDLVSMQTQADKAYEVLDDFKAITAPEALTDVHADYVAACESLEEALDAYIDLATEVEGTSSGKVNTESYTKRLEEIQALYDEGIAKLEAADNAVAGKEMTVTSSAQA